MQERREHRLKEESLDAYELAYTGTSGKTTLGIALYLNTQDDNINFVNLRRAPASTRACRRLDLLHAHEPGQGVDRGQPGSPITVNPFLMGALALVPPQFGGPIRLPENVFTYLNLGPIRNKGIELSIEHTFNDEFSGFANYSYQDTPEVLDADAGQIPYPINEVGVPAKNRFNLGLNWNSKRFLGSATLNYCRQGLLERRARPPLPRLHRLLHHGERQLRREVGGRQVSRA